MTKNYETWRAAIQHNHQLLERVRYMLVISEVQFPQVLHFFHRFLSILCEVKCHRRLVVIVPVHTQCGTFIFLISLN